VPNEAFNQPSSHAIGGNGGLYSREAIQYRNPLDARRSTALRDGAYPDGYLGFQSGDRQQDKLLEALGKSLNRKPYQRGVHKGSKIGAQDYFWPPDFQPDLRLKAEANYIQTKYTMDVKRAKPHGSPIELLASSTSKHPVSSPLQMNDYRKYGVNPGVNPIVPRQPSKEARKFGYLPSYAT
jgi:hypothetical protein